MSTAFISFSSAHSLAPHLVPTPPQVGAGGEGGRAVPPAHRGQVCGEGWAILALAIQPDHIHLFVRATPSQSATEVVQECTKGSRPSLCTASSRISSNCRPCGRARILPAPPAT